MQHVRRGGPYIHLCLWYIPTRAIRLQYHLLISQCQTLNLLYNRKSHHNLKKSRPHTLVPYLQNSVRYLPPGGIDVLRLMIYYQLRETGASMVNDDTTSLLCGLLDLHDAAIISEVATASGGELFVDFLVHVCLIS